MLAVAGRTDAGVHARGQVAHVDVPDDIEPARVGRRLNGVLDRAIRVTQVRAAPPGFHARFSASSRRYVYRVGDAPWGVDPLRRHETLAWPRRLDAAAMGEAGATLIGEHDFAAYCRYRPGAGTVRALLGLWVTRLGDLVEVQVEADAFCQKMVRSLVGALLAVGERRRPTGWPAEVLARRLRDPAATVVAPHGLCLVEVCYPADEELADRASLRSRRSLSAPAEAG